ncbi:hypothetical protein OY671_008968, partial [Metschnikowia pulcherrima]
EADAGREGRFESSARASSAGGVHSSVAGADAASALTAAAERSPLSAADRASAAEASSERENHGTTAIGAGVAIPHPRSPLVFPVAAPVVALCFLERPVDFGAADGKPVHSLFLSMAPTVRVHLALSAESAAASHEPAFQDAVARRAPIDEILAASPGKP